MRLLHLGSFDFQVLSHPTNRQLEIAFYLMERVMGIEPTYSAWKAAALPLCYTRTRLLTIPSKKMLLKMVERAGFEPANSKEDRFTVCWL